MSRLLGIAACQLEVIPGEIEKNLENLVKQIELVKFYSPWVRIVVASELILQGSPNSQELAQKIPGPISDFLFQSRQSAQYLSYPGIYV